MFSIRKISFVLLISFSCIFSAWNGTTIKEPSTKLIDGLEYYDISSPEELAWFAEEVNSGNTAINAQLSADIDLGSHYLGIGKNEKVAFNGIFEGNSHTISRIRSESTYSGLFGVVSSGTVKNFIIDGSLYLWGTYVGGAVAYAMSESKIEGVINRSSYFPGHANEKKDKNIYVGGVVGYTSGKVENCINEANISHFEGRDTSFVGGIVGYAHEATLINLQNSGTINGSDFTGGIAGLCIALGEDLANTGSIKGVHSTGGICGSGGILSNSLNKGDIKGVIAVGGICGENCKITNSTNIGKIKLGPSNIGGTTLYIGGICGQKCNTTYSINKGEVEADTLGFSSVYVGGVNGFTNSEINFCANFGNITAYVVNLDSRKIDSIAYVGGITGGTNSNILNVFNQGNIKSTQYAAGITPIISSKDQIIKNFYVAIKSIEAPYKAGFIYQNESDLVQNGYFDGDIWQDTILPKESFLVNENNSTTANLFVSNTKTMQSDSFAYILEKTNNEIDNSSAVHWSRDSSYPVFSDSIHHRIYQTLFISHKENLCSNDYTCILDTIKKYYKGTADSIPALQNGKWVLFGEPYMTPLNDNYKLNWMDKLIIASYPNCNEFAETNTGCCINYILEFQKNYANEMNHYYTQNGNQHYRISADSAYTNFCLDDNNNGILNWNDSTNYWYTYFKSMENDLNSAKTNKSSSSMNSCSSTKTSSSSTKMNFISIASSTPFAIHIHAHTLQISTAPIGTIYAILDLQGRVLKKGRVTSENFNITMSQAGSYIIRVGNHTQRISVK